MQSNKIAFRARKVSNVAIGGGSTAIGAAFSSGVQEIRLVATVDCYVLISPAGTAVTTTTGVFLPAGIPEYFIADGGALLTVISATIATGNLNVVELAR